MPQGVRSKKLSNGRVGTRHASPKHGFASDWPSVPRSKTQTASRPDEYKLLFHCGTKLVDTFKDLYPNVLTFEGNRAIVLHKTADLPIAPLKHCISGPRPIIEAASGRGRASPPHPPHSRSMISRGYRMAMGLITT